ncbi:MAG: ribosome maturation factor RimM [Gammaproteobacteria bacterium]
MKRPKKPNPKPAPAEAAEQIRLRPPRDDSPLIVGEITGQHGVRGWLKIFSHMRPVEEILQCRRWLLSPQHAAHAWRDCEVAEARAQGKRLLAKLAGIDTREAAEELTGMRIAVRRSQLPAAAAGEHYWSDLIGLRVVNRDGVLLGRVDHLLETGANDVLAVAHEDAHGVRAERLLPWGAGVIDEVDAAGGCIRVDWEAEQ